MSLRITLYRFHLTLVAGFGIMNETPTDRKRIIVFGFCLGGAALFMYLSFIAKVVFSGP